MSVSLKLGLVFGVVLSLSIVLVPGWWGLAAMMGIAALLSLVHARIAWNRARLPWFGYALVVNAISAGLLALLLVVGNELSLPGSIALGAGVAIGFLASAWLMRRQGGTRPTAWRELAREMESSSVAGVVLGRPLRALESRSG